MIETPLQDCKIIKNVVHGDDRGFFLESFNQKTFNESGIDFEVKQINFARSQENVFRGLHYQLNPHAQAKLVGVITGGVIDIVVDLRKDSDTFLKSFSLEIVSQDTFLLIPRGFAHGYYTLEDGTTFYYAVDNFYNPSFERCIRYNDKNLGLELNFNDAVVSEKDKNSPLLNDAEFNF